MLFWAVLCHVVSTGVLHGFVQGSHRALAALVSYTSCPVLDRTVLRLQVSYRGSTEERSDLLHFYNEFGGSDKCCAVLCWACRRPSGATLRLTWSFGHPCAMLCSD